jgi:hypothetical protein
MTGKTMNTPRPARGIHRFALPYLPALLLAALAITAAVLYQRPLMLSGLNIYDEGIILVGASRVMRGELPYRDFWSQYSPGQFYTLAALFSATDKSVMAARWFDVLTRAALALVLTLLASRAAGSRRAWLVWPLAVMWLTYYGFFSYPLFQGLLFSCAALYAFLRGLTNNRHWLIAAGVAFGLAFAFRHDMSAYLSVAIALTAAAHAWSTGTRFLTLLKSLLPMIVAAALIVAPVTLFFAAQVAPGELATQLLLFPLLEFPRFRDLPYPKLDGNPENLPFYAPFLVYGLSMALALWQLTKRDPVAQPRALAMFGMALFGAFGFNQARVRSDLIHTVHFFMLALALLPALWPGPASAPRDNRSSDAGAGARFALGMLSPTLMLIALLAPLNHYVSTLQRRDLPALQRRIANSPPIAAGVPLEDWQQAMLMSLRFYSRRGESVYIGLSRHDKVFANDVMSYFLFDRPIPTRYHEIHPGIVNTEPVQREMIAELTQTQPVLLYLTDMFEGANEPNESAKSNGVTLLDAYLKQHYSFYSTAGPFQILKRKGAP